MTTTGKALGKPPLQSNTTRDINSNESSNLISNKNKSSNYTTEIDENLEKEKADKKTKS